MAHLAMPFSRDSAFSTFFFTHTPSTICCARAPTSYPRGVAKFGERGVFFPLWLEWPRGIVSGAPRRMLRCARSLAARKSSRSSCSCVLSRGLLTNSQPPLFYEIFSASRSTLPSSPLLLISGIGKQCIDWERGFVAHFQRRNFRVIRFDSRDCGLSGDGEERGYSLDDMAGDALAVLDAACGEASRAHILGCSLGALIALKLALRSPERVLTLTSALGSTGERAHHVSSRRAMELSLAPLPTDRASFIRAWIEGLREWGTKSCADEARWAELAGRRFDRRFNPAGEARQMAALMAHVAAIESDGGAFVEALRRIEAPTLVLHGDSDNLVGLAGAERVAALIPRARLALIRGGGHDHPPPHWPIWANAVAQLRDEAAAAEAARGAAAAAPPPARTESLGREAPPGARIEPSSRATDFGGATPPSVSLTLGSARGAPRSTAISHITA